VTVGLDVRGRAARWAAPRLRRELVRQVGRAMAAAGVGEAELALSLVDDAEIHALNRQYAGEDHATDVLSFSQREGEGAAGAHVLGDVVISIETAERQAVAGGRPLVEELVHLAVHGLAHLLGYDHATRTEERVMFGYEARLRAEAAGHRGVRRIAAPRKTKAR
jgi:probable rRNA maturation factor